MKVYHGIPKSVTDEHTIFYADFDGVIPQSPVTKTSTEAYGYSPTGYGILFPSIQNQTSTGLDGFSINSNSNKFTIDFWATMKSIVSYSYQGRLFVMYFKKQGGSTTYVYMERDSATNKFHVWCADNGGYNLVFGGFDFTSTNLNTPHHFRFVFKVGEYSKFYLDGKEMTDVTYHNILPKDIVSLTALNLGGKNFLISDVHISNIDRGDYFPNLPQDFIEGKAVIKPRIGQQQIKGDPMYSQVTELKVLNANNIKPSDYYKIGDYIYYTNNPELKTTGSYSWASSSIISIKGLNGEIISGVIDTDTALTKVTKSNLNTNNIITIDVEDTSKFAISDVVRMYIPSINYASGEATIQSIDNSNKTITLTSKLTNASSGSPWGVIDLAQYGDYLIFETTASSSAPIVKTQDGIDVVGTWSGLGTNEVTFTLGENADISGKDLYVTYALTMPLGNSDFPELPHTIERAWGENGVEMKPVNHIVITDDFRGKISGSSKECPHIVKAVADSARLTPNDSRWSEWTDYSKFNQLDNDSQPASTTLNAYIPMQLFSFNLIEMVERKLGCEIPSANKVQWLKDNIISYSCTAYGKGTHPSGNKYVLNNYCHAENRWYGDPRTHTLSTITSVEYVQSQSIWIVKSIDDNGFVHFIVYTDSSDGVTTSIVYTDYLELKLTLKTDSTFTTLYCENTRAREDKCNPVLIQKETKTVKRYLPSKECFVTECITSGFKGTTAPTNLYSSYSDALAIRDYQLNSMGTGKFITFLGKYDYVASLCNITKESAYQFDSSSIVENLSEVYSAGYHDAAAFGTGIMYAPRGVTFATRPWGNMVDTKNIKCTTFIQTIPYLISNNNEVVLCLINAKFKNRKYTGEEVYYFILPNRPLIK